MKVMAHMYDVPTEHTGTNMSYKAYKDPLNRRLKYLKDMIGAYRAALDTRHQKTPADLLVNFAKAQTERHEKSQKDLTRNALLELQALCNDT
jgi:hypothetical protein